MGEILGGVLHRGIGGVATEAEHFAREPHDLMRGRIADEAGQFLFEVRAQQKTELTIALQKLRVPAHLYGARPQQMLGRGACKSDEVHGAALDLGVELAVRIASDP